MWAMILPILGQIKCSNPDLCPYGTVESSKRAIEDFNANKILILLSVAICLSIACFNGFGVSVTKNASAAQRSTIDTSRTVIIWIFFLIVPMNGKREDFSVLQLFGFIFLVFGTLVYTEILVLPFLGFDQYTKVALKRQQDENSALLDGGVTNLTVGILDGKPHQNYDNNQIQRVTGYGGDKEFDTGDTK